MPKKKPTKNEKPKAASGTARKEEENSTEVKSFEVSNAEKLEKELNWCIEQLRLGLMTQKANKKQTQESIKIIKTLSSSSAPLVKKRQIMRQVFGDYRKKIDDEDAKWLKDAERLRRISSIKSISQPSKSGTFLRTSRKNGSTPSSLSKRSVDEQEKFLEDEAGSNNLVNSRTSPEPFKFNFSIPDE